MVVMWDVNLTTLVFLGLTHTQCGDCTLEIIECLITWGKQIPNFWDAGQVWLTLAK